MAIDREVPSDRSEKQTQASTNQLSASGQSGLSANQPRFLFVAVIHLVFQQPHEAFGTLGNQAVVFRQ